MPPFADGEADLYAQKRVADYEPYLPSFQPGPDGIPHLTVHKNPYSDELVDVLQYLESTGSFWLNIRRIDWDSSKQTWIPESDIEKGKLRVSSIQTELEYERTPVALDWNRLAHLLSNRDRWSKWTIPLSFLREGRNEFLARRYVQAFFNFYFYIEGLYGNGKTKNYQVIHEFRRSTHLQRAATQLLENFSETGFERHSQKLDQFLAEEHCSRSVDGVLELLVKVRGNLHHFAAQSSRRKGHPLNQRDFETVSYAAFTIATLTSTLLFTGEDPA